MLPKSCVVQGYRGLFTPEAVRAYRHYGVVLVENFLPADTVRQLTQLCNTTVRQRGDAVFPGIDPQHQNGASGRLQASLQPKGQPGTTTLQSTGASTAAASTSAASPVTSELGFGSGPFPPEAVAQAAEADRLRRFDTRTQKVKLTMKNQRAVDRAFRRLAKLRNSYNRHKHLPKLVDDAEELSGEMSDARIQEIRDKITYDDLKKSFQGYRDSGMLEEEIRHDHHINDVLRFMQDWPRTWCWLWQSCPELRAMALTADGVVGHRVGAAAGHLSGEVILRVYGDSAVQDAPLMNAVPLGFSGLGLNFAHPQALSAQLGLAASDNSSGDTSTLDKATLATQVLMPGSHHVLRQLSRDGREMDRFVTGGIFDVGSVVRRLPELRHLPLVEVPPLAPGAALFFNHYLLVGWQPTLHGAAQQAATTVASSPVGQVSTYALTLMPDRCVFDGQRNSWASRDTHGPLYTYKAGDMLTDDAKFPVIHRALDIE